MTHPDPSDEQLNAAPVYRPYGPRGQTGPAFDFATLACLWILKQAEPSRWTWESVRRLPPIVSHDGLTLNPATETPEGDALIAFYERAL